VVWVDLELSDTENSLIPRKLLSKSKSGSDGDQNITRQKSQIAVHAARAPVTGSGISRDMQNTVKVFVLTFRNDL